MVVLARPASVRIACGACASKASRDPSGKGMDLFTCQAWGAPGWPGPC